MPDPTTSIAVGTTSAASGTLAVLASSLGVPAPTAIAAILGATIAVSQSGKLEWSQRGLWAGLLAFVLALAMGLFGGPPLGQFIAGLAAKLVPMPAGALDAICALLLSLLGQSVILPALSKRLGVEIEKRGGTQ